MIRHNASATINGLILLAPRSRSTNVIGTSTIRTPARYANRDNSTWNEYPCEHTDSRRIARSADNRYTRKPPVASDTGIPNAIRAYRFPHRDSTNRRHGQFTTRAPPTHRDPITTSASRAAASRAGRSSGACEPSASISTTAS